MHILSPEVTGVTEVTALALLHTEELSYTKHNGTRIYNLIPDKVALVKYGNNASVEPVPEEGEDAGNHST